MSLFLYAGSMQYTAVGLMTGGASLLTVALTTLEVNARHLFYGFSMVEPYQNAGAKKPYLIFALTDETYSLVCLLVFGPDAFWIPSMLSIAAVTCFCGRHRLLHAAGTAGILKKKLADNRRLISFFS